MSSTYMKWPRILIIEEDWQNSTVILGDDFNMEWLINQVIVDMLRRAKESVYEEFKLTLTGKKLLNVLRLEARGLLEQIRPLRQLEGYGGLIKDLEAKHKQLIREIRKLNISTDITHRSWEFAMETAKKKPITDYYIGKLRKTGSRHMGKCPFHEDGSPSFVIYETNTANCFGCGWNGDVIDFVSKLNNLDFKETIRLLQ